MNRHPSDSEARAVLRTSGELLLLYQPIFDLFNFRLTGVEALLRWRSDGRLYRPHGFLGEAEKWRLMGRIDAWVLSTACCQLATWRRRYPSARHVKVHVNLGWFDIDHRSLLETVSGALEKSGLGASSLVLEVQERLVTGPLSGRLVYALLQVRQLGVAIVLDRCASVPRSTWIDLLGIRGLKLDHRLLSSTAEAPRPSRDLVRLALESHRLGLETVAVGLDTWPLVSKSQDLGCTRGQGFCLSEPADEDTIECHLASTSTGFWNRAPILTPLPLKRLTEAIDRGPRLPRTEVSIA